MVIIYETSIRYSKTLGQLNFLGVDEKYKYENGERTDKTVYAYKLGSKEQGEQITVKHRIKLIWIIYKNVN